MIETFGKPSAGAIIEKKENGIDYILIQKRHKKSDCKNDGLLEIPAGKIREYENIFDCLRREVFEETGLKLTYIQGEDKASMLHSNGYDVISFNPFYSTENLKGVYSTMLQVFICKACGEPIKESDEAISIKWIPIKELKELLQKDESMFYPMSVNSLKKYITYKYGESLSI